MADQPLVEIVRQGIHAFHQWRIRNHNTVPDLHSENLAGVNLEGADLSKSILIKAVLRNARLSQADLFEAHLANADLTGADLTGANLIGARLMGANLTGASLAGANLQGAFLQNTNFRNADLVGADLYRANLTEANLAGADLSEAHLDGATLVETSVAGASLAGAHVYGVAVWDLKGTPADQTDLVITPEGQPSVTVDDLKVAQFIYLLLSNPTVRDIIDTITSKVVLILGRFTSERKAVLDELRNELRLRDLSPVVFDFSIPTNRDMTDTVRVLAGMARFVIADLTDPATVPYELASFVPGLLVPVRPIILAGQHPPQGFKDLRRRYEWLLEPYTYDNLDALMENLETEVIQPADDKRNELAEGRRT